MRVGVNRHTHMCDPPKSMCRYSSTWACHMVQGLVLRAAQCRVERSATNLDVRQEGAVRLGVSLGSRFLVGLDSV